MKTDSEERAAYIDGLRQIADFLEQHPNVPEPSSPIINVFVQSKNSFQRAIKKSGPWEKRTDGSYVYCRKCFGPHVFNVNLNHSMICERVVTGKRTVPRQEAIEEYEEEITEWRCPDSFLSAAPITEAPVGVDHD